MLSDEMGQPSQYPVAADLNLAARLKLVGTLHMRGYSPTRIARELNYDIRTANKDIAAVIDRYREFEDIDKHLHDVTARMGEQLTKLNEQESILWKQLDWAAEWVIQRDGFGKPIYEAELDPGAEDKTSAKALPLYGPRRPGMIPQLVGQLQSINKQQSEMLGLLNKNVDISVTLQKTELFQIRIMEVIKEADPDTYTKLHRVLKAAEATFKPATFTGGSGRSLQQVLEGDYEGPVRVGR